MKTLIAALLLGAISPAVWAGPYDSMVGYLELQAIVDLFGSPFGLAIGLLVGVWGIWTWFVGQNMGRGILLLVLGVVVTGFPTLYHGVRMDTYNAATEVGGSGEKDDFLPYIGPTTGKCPPSC